jgi:UDP-N-acetylglucosamine:LPS N-acetylglucosamine transferase
MKKILAVASGGGHWDELMLIKDAFDINELSEVKYVTTIIGLPQEDDLKSFFIVKDANKDNKISLIISFFQFLYIFCRFKPEIVISTGAAIGVFAIYLGKLTRAKTIWIDSIANPEKISLSGKYAKNACDLVITQWEHLSDGKSVFYYGSVI